MIRINKSEDFSFEGKIVADFMLRSAIFDFRKDCQKMLHESSMATVGIS